MIARSIEARIVKLENHSVRDGEYYLLWRLPGDEVGAAVAAAQLPRGTRIICPEWFGELPVPRARWVNADTRVPKHEEESIYQTVLGHMANRGITDNDLREDARVHGPDHRASEMTDLELDFAIFGVTVQ